MKALTFRLGQFAFFGLIFTVLFHLVLNQCISTGNGTIISLCAIAYFCLMFFIGWYFGKKDFIGMKFMTLDLDGIVQHTFCTMESTSLLIMLD